MTAFTRAAKCHHLGEHDVGDHRHFRVAALGVTRFEERVDLVDEQHTRGTSAGQGEDAGEQGRKLANPFGGNRPVGDFQEGDAQLACQGLGQDGFAIARLALQEDV